MACPAGRRLALPLALLAAPIPLPPFPSGRGIPKVDFAGGFDPRHSCTEPSTALADTAMQEPGGGLARQVAGTPCLELYFFPPSPLTRARRALFPAGRGIPKVYFAGGFAPGTPALNRLRHMQTPPCRNPAGLPGRSAADLAFSFISFPHPPCPPSRREGGF